jgi:hypothetical protein
MWQWLMALLVWLSADPHAADRETPRAAGAVAVAYAQFAADAAPPAPTPKPGCCDECGGKGYIVHGDGHRTACPCPTTCRCKAAGVALTPEAPAAPAGRR